MRSALSIDRTMAAKKCTCHARVPTITAEMPPSGELNQFAVMMAGDTARVANRIA